MVPVLLMGTSGPLHLGGHSSPDAERTDIGPQAVLPEVAEMKKVLAWLAIAFALFYVIQAPEQSAAWVRTAGTALGDAATSLADFVQSLA